MFYLNDGFENCLDNHNLTQFCKRNNIPIFIIITSLCSYEVVPTSCLVGLFEIIMKHEKILYFTCQKVVHIY